MKDNGTTAINANIPTELHNLVIAEAEKRKTSKTEILIDALTLYFQTYNHMEFVDSITSKVIEDKTSIMIPKALYMSLLGITEKEVETHIKKNKLETVVLKISKDEEISYIKQSLNDKKSMFKMLIENQHEIEKLKINTIDNNNKISTMEQNIALIMEKQKENKT